MMAGVPHLCSSWAHESRFRGTLVTPALVLVALLLVLATHPAAAGVGWCRTDPVVVIDGRVADVFVSVPLDALSRVTGPTEIVITVPVGVTNTWAVPGPGFGYGEVVTFDQSPALSETAEGVEILVKVYLPATDDEMPVLVEFAPHVIGVLAPDGAEKTANTWIRLRTSL